MSQVFVASLVALAAALALLFSVVFRASRDTIIESSERIRADASREIGDRVAAFLAHAPETERLFQEEVDRGLVEVRDLAAVERALFTLLLARPDVGEITLTYGEATGFDADGAIQLAPAPRGQLSAVRSGETESDRLWSRHVHQSARGFVAETGRMEELIGTHARRDVGETVPDPTEHLTFVTPARKEFAGRLLWSDLHFSQLDGEQPEARRSVEVSVQRVVTDRAGKFAGVLRVGLRTAQLDRAVDLPLAPGVYPDPHRIFLCDADGRLITRLSPDDRLVESDGDLRIEPAALSPEVAAALATSDLRLANVGAAVLSGEMRSGGEDFLTTFRGLAGTQEWLVGIVVPRAFYLGPLAAMRDRLLALSLGIIVLVVVGGGLMLRAVKRAQAQIVRESARMSALEFSPSPTRAAFRDVRAILESLEQAKTAMRAMGKYVPIELVRRLYRERSEPVLGGEPREISIMFTDIRDFTSFSEKLPPDRLADALGRYLDMMAGVIQRETRGTIDKYIGDAIMALWNAPEPVAGHARMACLAALRCREAGVALALAEEWRGLPIFETRFGLHRGEALVGHFGAHDRMNYTAIGDSVNLASRLEALNKQYGTSILASEAIVEEAREEFDFRLLDIVAVKGKTEATRIYELLGRKGDGAVDGRVAVYEKAFAAYLARDFSGAIALLATQGDDAPSEVLRERCGGFLREPPPAEWGVVFVARSK